ncbi:MAG: hypothetical protein RR893_12750 [Clostridia bacterium]
MKESPNVYYASRRRAAERNPRLNSRTGAAELRYCGAGSLDDYENGRTPTPCSVVRRMIEVYGDHSLRGEHIRAYCPLLPDYGSENSQLAEVALGWSVEFSNAQGVAIQFATVARDGRITRDEIPMARVIREKALEVMRVMQESVTAIDNALAELESVKP